MKDAVWGGSTPNWGCDKQGIREWLCLPCPLVPHEHRAGSPGAACAACTAGPSPRDGAARPALASSWRLGWQPALPAVRSLSALPYVWVHA